MAWLISDNSALNGLLVNYWLIMPGKDSTTRTGITNKQNMKSAVSHWVDIQSRPFAAHEPALLSDMNWLSSLP